MTQVTSAPTQAYRSEDTDPAIPWGYLPQHAGNPRDYWTYCYTVQYPDGATESLFRSKTDPRNIVRVYIPA